MPPLLSDIASRLAPLSDTPLLDASVLLAHLLGKPRAWVLAHPAPHLSPSQQGQLETALARLENGEPLPYLLGHWEFFGMDFDITPDVLIPRPETELLVEKAIAWLQTSSLPRFAADVGTGSGIIAVTIAANLPHVRFLATDLSPAALQVAQINARKFQVDDRIRFVECDLLPSLPEQPLHLLCANLPYIPTNTLRSLAVYRREPTLALDGGADGLDHLRRLMRLAPAWMLPNSLILLEIEASLGGQSLDLARSAFPHANICLHKDLSGHDRLLEISL
jgi:release factor glutamine methyltransferase